MKIDIARLADERELELREEWDPAEKDVNVAGLEFEGPLSVTAWVKKDGGIILARIEAEGRTRLTCARCSREFQSDLCHSFSLVYPLDPAEKQQVIDDNVREELILAYPAKILCSQDCRGLCAKCGADLNTEQCRCK